MEDKTNDLKEWKLLNFCEIDKYAATSYCAVHDVDESLNLGDITQIDVDKLRKELGEVTFITHGSPCQSFSLAGKQAGGDEGSGTRSSLMWDTVRIVEKLKPKLVLWENVKNVLSPKHKHNFDKYLNTLENLGYNNYYKVLNSKNYLIPQNRERIFVLSIRKDVDNGKFKFPESKPLKLKLKDLLEKHVDEKYYLSDEQLKRIQTSTYHSNQRRIQEKDWCDTLCARDYKDPKCVKVADLNYFGYETNNRVYSPSGCFPTLRANMPSQTIDENDSLLEQSILMPEKTKKGYKKAYEGDGVYINRPHQKRGVVQRDMIQTIKTSPDIGVVVKDGRKKSLFTDNQAKMITYDGNVKRYINSDIVDEFKEGQIVDISFPNGYNKGKRTHDICPSLNCTTTQSSFVYKEKDIVTSCAIRGRYNKEGNIKQYLEVSDKEYSNAITTVQKDSMVNSNLRIRKLTPKETWRLQGFDDHSFEKARKALNETYYKGSNRSGSQLYKQAGNSITTTVPYYILLELYKVMPYLFDNMTLLSLFSGIGAIEVALNKLFKNKINK